MKKDLCQNYMLLQVEAIKTHVTMKKDSCRKYMLLQVEAPGKSSISKVPDHNFVVKKFERQICKYCICSFIYDISINGHICMLHKSEMQCLRKMLEHNNGFFGFILLASFYRNRFIFFHHYGKSVLRNVVIVNVRVMFFLI